MTTPTSRWIEILATTPSGKRQFVCRICGRTSVFPDKTCPGQVWFTGGDGFPRQVGAPCDRIEKDGLPKGAVLGPVVWNRE